MLDATEYRRWRVEAEAALRGAGAQRDIGLHNWACFLAEQAARLGVKGLLHGAGAGAWGHDLVELGERLAEATGADAPEEVKARLQRLSRHYIPARYPDAHPGGGPGTHYGDEDARAALDDAAAVLEFVDRVWSRLEEAAGG